MMLTAFNIEYVPWSFWRLALYLFVSILLCPLSAQAQSSIDLPGLPTRVVPLTLEDHAWPDLTSIVNKALESIAKKEKSAILPKYVAVRYEAAGDRQVTIFKYIVAVAGVALCSVLLFVAWNRILKRQVRQRTAALVHESIERQKALTLLEDSEARFLATFEQAAVGIAHVGVDGKFLRLNQKFCDIVGYTQDEMLDLSFQEITHRDDLKKDLDQLNKLLDGAQDTYVIEKRYIRKDTEIVWVNLTVSVVRKEEGAPGWLVSVVKDITQRKKAEQDILDYQKRLKNLASQLTVVEEKERRRIAADLHDHVGQTLAISRLQLATAIRVTDDPIIREQLSEISRTLLKTTQDTRHLIFELSSPTMNEIGLGPAINEWVEEKLNMSHDFDFELVDNLSDCGLEEDLGAILFRNLRELLTNTIKHARANKVSVHLEKNENEIRASVQDNGTGFNPDLVMHSVDPEGGFGLFSIQERMAGLGGKLEIRSAPHQGCTIIMSVPWVLPIGSSS